MHLFDGGSQRTFVTTEVLHKQQLKVIGEEVVTIRTFGGAENVIKEN